MKKIIALVLIAMMVLSMSACTINKTDVAVLWSGSNDAAVVPNSLINAIDRAMYIENISYKHYAASGDQAAQTAKAEELLKAGCAALMVELVDASAAQAIVDLAKAKDVPVVFFNCDVEKAVVDSYAKCALVTTDAASLTALYGTMLDNYLNANIEKKKPSNKDMDLNDDGKIHYLALGDVKLEKDSIELKDKDEVVKTVQLVPVEISFAELKLQAINVDKAGLFGTTTEEYGRLVTADGTVIEMILMDDDTKTLDTLVALQAMGMNSTKLATHYIPVFTVGADADYKAHVMKDLPAGADARKAYLESQRVLVDMTGISQEEWTKWETKSEKNEVDTMLYNTTNQIDAGKLAGTVVEDYDSIAVAAAAVLADLLSGHPVESSTQAIPYTAYPSDLAKVEESK